MKHFKEPYTPESLKKQYRDLARENHPDMGGNLAIMQEVNVEYEYLTKPDKKSPYRNEKYQDLDDLINDLCREHGWDKDAFIKGAFLLGTGLVVAVFVNIISKK